MGPALLALLCMLGFARPAQATNSINVLVYGPGDSKATSYFPSGTTFTVATAAQWTAMTTAQFAAYDIIWIDDGNCATSPSIYDTANANRDTWAAAVTGRIHITGADMDFHASFQGVAKTYIQNSVTWLGGQGHTSNGGKTGLFVEFGCTDVVRADMLTPFGTFAGGQLDANPTVINAPSSPLLSTINTVAQLKLSSYSHEQFSSYPSYFSPLVSLDSSVLDIFATSRPSASLSIAPQSPSTTPRGSIAFSASGGAGGYTFALVSKPSGGSITGNGVYVAGSTGGVTDVVKVTDSSGTSVQTNVSVGAPVSIVPASTTAAPHGTVMFLASGGSGAGFAWSFVTNNSGGSIDASTGIYVAGNKGSVSDTIKVTDNLGNSATASVAVGATLVITPTNVATSPHGTIDFNASGGSGSYVFTIDTNNSGATINASTGVYIAGNTGGVTDVVRVSDGNGASAATTVNVGSGPLVSPGSVSVPPRGSATFSASGGAGGYKWSLLQNQSGGGINATSGAYTAGSVGNSTDVVLVVDAFGNSATASAFVGPGVSLSPQSSSVAPHGPIAFSAAGGSGSGFTWAIGSNGSGGTINSATGAYVAGGKGGVTDVIVAVDPLGNSATATVQVTQQLSIAPSNPATPPRGAIAFAAIGGSGAGYQWSLATNASGGSINPASGSYVAGATAGVTDVVRVIDSLGNLATVNVAVGAGITIVPSPANTSPRGTIAFMATGGNNGGYAWAIATNASGASIDSSTGIYIAGSNGGVTDVVRVTDALGNSATANVTLTANLSINPPSANVPPKGSLGFTAAGGSGFGYKFAISSNASNGSIDASTGVYKAGSGCGVNDVVTVTDNAGNSASAAVKVGACLVITPPPPAALVPRATVTFTASGGSGTGYSWSVPSNPSGGTMNASTGVFAIGPNGGVNDIVAVADSLGNITTVTVTIGTGVVITPSSASVAPRATIAFQAAGGGGSYQWTLTTNASSGSIDAASGLYKAGVVGGSTDVVTVVDAFGNSASATIAVKGGVVIAPSNPAVSPLGKVAFVAAGGSGTGFTWTIPVNKSGATIDSGSGAYVAGSIGNVTDAVTVTDNLGNSASVNVSVGAGVIVSPAVANAAPRGPIAFSASGGSGTGYVFTLATNNSGASIAATGAYVAGTVGGVDDVVRVADSLGNQGTALVHVGAGIAITPAAASVAPRGTQAFTATGGAGSGYTWTLSPNNSGGSIDSASGLYTAGPTGSVTDGVTVRDALGNSATASVAVGAPIVVRPTAPSVPPRGAIAFSAVGGGGTGYAWALSTNKSGGSINSATGAYVAGPTGDVTDVVTVVDLLHNITVVPVTVTTGVHATPEAAATAPRGTVAFTVSGGDNRGFVWALQTNASGATLSASGTNATYIAGTTGGTVDVITVTDDLGNSDTMTIAVGAGITIAPSKAATAPEGTIGFVASGGSGTGYVWLIADNQSHGSIDSATGIYKAGDTGNVSDRIVVTDSFGNSATTSVSVGAGITITPATGSTAPRGSLSFAATGGSGSGYVWSMAAAPSGGAIGANNGVYVAGSNGSQNDVVMVTDSFGNRATALVTVTASLAITPPAQTVAPNGKINFAVSGGSGSGITWSLTQNQSGATLNTTTGKYQAGATGNTVDLVTVRDSLGNTTTATVTVGAGVTLTPTSVSTTPRGTQQFVATGGSGAGYSWQVATNASGATITKQGLYTAGDTGSVNDVVLVSDSLGNLATAIVTVGPGLTITPTAPFAPPNGKINFSATGGTNTGLQWTLTSNGSGGTIKKATGVYNAGPTGSSVDVVTVTDSLGNRASVSVSVGAGITINPTNPTVPPHGPVGFSATGGSGGPYTWIVATSGSGGSIASNSGAYLAGDTGNSVDVIVVTDKLGNTATTNVNVGPGLTVSPPVANLAPLGRQQLTVSGGSGGGYSWALTDNPSGGTVTHDTGFYMAGTVGSVSDVVTVTDSLGNRALAVINVSQALVLSPATASVAPRAHLQLTGQFGAGGYVYSMGQNGSGATVNGSTGDYQAGAMGGSTDTVNVVDGNGALATATISVGPGVSVTPSAPQVAPRGFVSFSAAGGSGSGFVWRILSAPSGGTIDTAGHYFAGGKGLQTDVIGVTDSLGNTATVAVSVGAGITLNPPSAATSPRGSVAFVATGGNGGGYTWAVSTNASGASIDGSGNYSAGSNGNVTDVVTVTDPLGNTATANIAVGPPVTVAPANVNLAPLGTQLFSVSGGSGKGYSWFILVNNSGGSINASSGAYTAGTIGGGNDVVAVIDSLGNLGQGTVVVGPALSLTPATTTVAPRGSVAFAANGGAGKKTFSLIANGSGAVINTTTGQYFAGPVGNTTDRIQVVDGNGALATARITVGAGIAVVPAMPSALPGEQIAFLATGGAGSGYTWSLAAKSGGTIDAASGIYTAGNAVNTTDVVSVVDALGNVAVVNVTVGLGITINPAHPSVPPRGSVAFAAAGGSGGYGWSMLVNASGGASINSGNGAYQAGSGGNVTDVVEVIDSVGNVASVPVAIGPSLTIAPANNMVQFGRTIGFSVVGGSGAGYSWSLVNPLAGSTINATTGLYKAGTAKGTDIVRVTDSLGNSSVVAVGVSATATSAAAQALLEQAREETNSATPAAAIGGGNSADGQPSAGGCQVGGGAGGPSGGAVVVGLALLALVLRRRRARA